MSDIKELIENVKTELEESDIKKLIENVKTELGGSGITEEDLELLSKIVDPKTLKAKLSSLKEASEVIRKINDGEKEDKDGSYRQIMESMKDSIISWLKDILKQVEVEKSKQEKEGTMYSSKNTYFRREKAISLDGGVKFDPVTKRLVPTGKDDPKAMHITQEDIALFGEGEYPSTDDDGQQSI